ncbi:glycosyltransferase [Actinokineospora auranticolor]|uniref:MGT family glycosyltransferase n=1 Tax=Actinokineospora auranticolor TaxID=155976 RepID=A0A2S6GTQ9_9PSEU|nr:macrolide family glycosyltransferase [Actinokineospora auranticolor]PPK68511.1 MGT family glycosyltransferase [Actinokineospora auranticolor]
MDTSRLRSAFFTFPGYGHLRPILPVAAELVDRGHEVTVVVADRYADDVARTGARVVTYRSEFPAAVPEVVTADDLAAAVVHYLEEAFAALPAAWAAFAEHPVDIVVEDALSTAVSGLVADRAGCPVVRAFPGFAGNDEVPVNGSEPDPDGPRFDAEHPAVAAFHRALPARLAALGVPGGAVDRVRARRAAANLVFVPREFQPRAECFDDSFVFVGAHNPPPPSGTWTPPADGSPVALISLGTSATHNPGFFRSCAEAFAGTGWRVVMTTADHLDADTAAWPDYVERYAWLDHNEVLPHTDVLVCQAGSGTLMDAFWHGVPVVTVPQQPDARVAARHVAELGLGRVHSGAVTGAAIRDAALAVAADTAVAARVAGMRSAARAAGGARRAADVLERVAAGSGITEDRGSDTTWT